MPAVISYTLAPDPFSPDEREFSAIEQARRSTFVATAEGVYLTRCGENYGLPRFFLLSDDEIYRNLIMVLAWLPKAVLSSIYGVLEEVLGTQSALLTVGERPWRVYEVKNNEIVVEIPNEVMLLSPENTTHLHGYYSLVNDANGLGTIVVVDGNAELSGTILGQELYVLISGTFEHQTINLVFYDASADQTTIQVDTPFSSPPVPGASLYVPQAGDEIVSFRGDYLATSGFAGVFDTAAGPDTDTLFVLGDATGFIGEGFKVTLSYSNTTNANTVSSLSYDSATNLTTIIVDDGVPGGLVRATISVSREQADTSTTAPHKDRPYLSRYGLFEVAYFYLLNFAKAAGVAIRVEKI